MLPLNKPQVTVANASVKFDPEGRLVDQDTRGFVGALMQALLAWTLLLRNGVTAQEAHPGSVQPAQG
jgi:hypothetical protein